MAQRTQPPRSGNEKATTVEGDPREPAKILAADGLRRLLDLTQPAALLLVAVLHFIADTEDPWRMWASLRGALAPDSYLVLCHGTDEGKPAVTRAAEKGYDRSVPAPLHMRSRAEIRRFFAGYELVEPGLVSMPAWRPDPAGATPAGRTPGDQSRFWGGLVGLAGKPG